MLWREVNFLWLLLPAALLLAALLWRLRAGGSLLGGFAEAALAPRLAPDVLYGRRRGRAVLRGLALAVGVVALAGPRWGFHWEQIHREGIDLVVAIDVSRSMLATDVKPNRLERAKLAVQDLVKLLHGDRIALVAFAGAAFLECPLTLDYAAFEQSLRALEVGIIPRGGTAVGEAVRVALDAFEARQGRHEAMILITDGEDHDGKIEEMAKQAAERGIKIYTVGIGTTEGEIIPLTGKGGSSFVKDRQGQVVKSRLNEEALQQIAATSGGAYVRGVGATLGLDEVFRDHIAKMERREVASTLERRYEDRFQIPLALALVLLVVEGFIPDRRKVRSHAGATALLLVAAGWVAASPASAWLDPPNDRAAEGNRLFEQKKFDEASAKYKEGLVDSPASPLLQFNLGASLYKEGKYDEAGTFFEKVLAGGAPEYIASAAYNLGNAQFQSAAALEAGDKQKALAALDNALASYRRAMGADPKDPDPKLGHELAQRKRAEVLKKIEEEKQQQEQQQQEQPQDGEQQPQDQQDQDQQDQAGEEQQQQEQPPQDQAGEDGEQQDEQQQEQPQEQAGDEQQEQPQEQAGGEPPAEQAAEEQPAGGAEGDPAAASEAEKSPDQQAAQAVIDTARSEELAPDEFQRKVKVAGELPVAEDW